MEVQLAKLEWGKKHECPNCSCRFYDLLKPSPLTCPKCNFVFATDVLHKARKGKASAKATADDDDEEEEEDIIEDDLMDNEEDDTSNLLLGDDEDDEDIPGVGGNDLSVIDDTILPDEDEDIIEEDLPEDLLEDDLEESEEDNKK